MKLPEYCEELGRAAKEYKNFSQVLTAHCVKCPSKIHKSCVESNILFLTLLLHLPEHECHVSCAPICAVATLALGGVFLGKRRSEPVRQDTCQNLTGNGERCDTPVVRTIRRDNFALVQGCEDLVLGFVGPSHASSMQQIGYQVGHAQCRRRFGRFPREFQYLPGDFPDFIWAIAISISIVLGGTSRSSLTSFCGIRSSEDS